MNLIVSKSKNSATYYIQKSFRSDAGKTTARIVERLGSMKELIARFGEEDPIGAARKYVAELTAEEKESKRKITVEYNPSLLIKNGEQRNFNGGYLFLQKVYHELGLDKICKKIEKNYKNEYDLNSILQMLLYTRILYPGSKRSSLEDAKLFIEQPKADIHQVYRALTLLSKESDEIQAVVYKNSLKLGKRHRPDKLSARLIRIQNRHSDSLKAKNEKNHQRNENRRKRLICFCQTPSTAIIDRVACMALL